MIPISNFFLQESCDNQKPNIKNQDLFPWVEQGEWKITDKSSAEQFRHTLRTSSRRPASVTITGSNWENDDLLNLLSKVATLSCKVFIKPDDVFKTSQETTHEWIIRVISGKHK